MTRFIKIFSLIGLTFLTGCGLQVGASKTSASRGAQSNSNISSSDFSWLSNTTNTSNTSSTSAFSCKISRTGAPAIGSLENPMVAAGSTVPLIINASGGTGSNYAFNPVQNPLNPNAIIAPVKATNSVLNREASLTVPVPTSFQGDFTVEATVANEGTTANCSVTLTVVDSTLTLTATPSVVRPSEQMIIRATSGFSFSGSTAEVVDYSVPNYPTVSSKVNIIRAAGNVYTLSLKDPQEQLTHIRFIVTAVINNVLRQTAIPIAFVEPLRCVLVASTPSAKVNSTVNFQLLAINEFEGYTNETVSITSIPIIPFADPKRETPNQFSINFKETLPYGFTYVVRASGKSVTGGVPGSRTCTAETSVYVDN